MTDPAAPAAEAPDYPRVVIRKDLRAGFVVLGAVAVLGVPLGWFWSALAPPEVVRTGGGDTATPLLSQTEHRFDALALFVLLGLAAGVLTGVVVWLLREYRGPVLAIAATAGALIAAWLAMRTGELLTVDGLVATAAGQFATRAPTVESSWAMLAQPLGVALAYSFAVAGNGHDDLGRTRS